MKKIWLGVAVVMAVIAVVGLAGCTAQGSALSGDVSGLNINLSSQQQGLWVSGEGKVTATPDVAIMTLGIESQETSVADAQAKAAAAMDKVMQALKDQGIADKDVQTQYFNIERITGWVEPTPEKGKEETIGYRVTNTVVAKLRDVSKAGTVIDAVIAAGGDLARVNSIAFTVDDPTPYYAQARDQAVQYAQQKAQQLASKAGFTLGKVTYMTENNYFPGPIYRNFSMAEGGVAVPAPTIDTSISAGELEITTTIQMAYEIE